MFLEKKQEDPTSVTAALTRKGSHSLSIGPFAMHQILSKESCEGRFSVGSLDLLSWIGRDASAIRQAHLHLAQQPQQGQPHREAASSPGALVTNDSRPRTLNTHWASCTFTGTAQDGDFDLTCASIARVYQRHVNQTMGFLLGDLPETLHGRCEQRVQSGDLGTKGESKIE